MNTPKPDDAPDKNKIDKKNKKKGPIRWEAVLPLAIIMVLTGLYFSFLFDNHLRHLIQFTGTHIHGAEVDVAEINTSFWRGSFELKGLEITDKKEPSRNLFSIGKIHFGFLWDALLRAKFVVELASIENIQVYSPRRRPGRVLPPDEEKGGNSAALAKLESGIISQTQTDYQGNLLGDLANIVGGADPQSQIKNIESELKTNLRIKELEAELNEKKKLWEQRIQALPSSRELKDFERRLKAIKIDTKDPVKFAASIKEIQTLVSEADQKIKMVRETSENLNGDLKKMDESFKELDQLVKQDIKDLEKHFKLPQIDVGDFSKKLFLKMFAEKLVTVQKYMAIAREYMPPEKSEAEKKADAEEQIVPRPRESGRNYTFPLAKGYPLFWMKKAQVSSEPNGSEYSGRIQGEILDLTSNPVQLGKPTEINISGDFPGQQIMGFSTQITLDHTTDKPKEIMRAAIESFPLEPQKFSDTDSLRFVLTEARGSSQMTAKLENQEIQILLHNKFKDLKYDIDAKSDVVKQILTRISQDIPIITLEARASGTWSNLKIGIRSNLGEEISKGFKRQLDEKLNEAKLKLKQLVDEKVSAERDKLKAEMDKLKGKLTQEVEQVKNQVEQTKKDAENQITQGKKSAEQGQKKQVEEAGKKVLEDLKKKFKIK